MFVVLFNILISVATRYCVTNVANAIFKAIYYKYALKTVYE